VKQVEFLEVILLHVTGAVVAKKMVQLRDTIGQVSIAYPVDYVDMFAGVEVVEAQPVGGKVGLGAEVDSATLEHPRQN
jgi:hypothetical protein